jgi:hypothetical protein
MPITILDYVKFQIGEQDSYTAQDFYSTGVDIMGGCEGCRSTLAAYNAYPSKSGYWRCADCIGQTGFATVGEFMNVGDSTGQDEPDPETTGAELGRCPACGETDAITETAFSGDRRHGYYFECTECGAVWNE